MTVTALRIWYWRPNCPSYYLRLFFNGLMAFSILSLCLLWYHRPLGEQSRVSHLWHQNISRPLTPTGPLCDRWIVVTTTSEPDEGIELLAALLGWRVVVVTNLTKSKKWRRCPNCEILDQARQASLQFLISDIVPYESHARKNVGYLYAIIHGAKFIYDTSKDFTLLQDLKGFDYGSVFHGVSFVGETLFNPYHHFGQSTLWPCGYPFSAIGKPMRRKYRIHWNSTIPLIQSSMADGDLDVDAIPMVAKQGEARPPNVQFDPVAPPAQLPKGVYSPFSSQTTLFSYGAFWALLLPQAGSQRVSDTRRSYWAQRLLWEIGGTIAFYPPNSYHRAGSSMEEMPLYQDTEKFLKFLNLWKCPSELSFFDCVESLTSELIAADLWTHSDLSLVRAWVRDLQRAGYTQPVRINRNNVTGNVDSLFNEENIETKKENKTLCGTLPTQAQRQARKESSYIEFIPHEMSQSFSFAPSIPKKYSVLRHVDMTSKVCPGFSLSNLDFDRQSTDFFHDILVIIVFHYSHYYRNVLYMEAAYRAVFPNLLYCGPNKWRFLEAVANITGFYLKETVTFVEVDVRCGFLAYACLENAVRAGYRVKGYLSMSDDVLLNPWNLLSLNKSRMWMTKSKTRPFDTTRQIRWKIWSKAVGKTALDAAVRQIRLSDPPPEVKSWDDIIATLQKTSGGAGKLMRGLVDLIYIPRRLAHNLEWYLPIFYTNAVFLEIAVPILLYGLEDNSEIESIEGYSLWRSKRKQVWTFFNVSSHYIHPVKLSKQKQINSFCSKFIPQMFKNLYGVDNLR